jgi:hypothetical protein
LPANVEGDPRHSGATSGSSTKLAGHAGDSAKGGGRSLPADLYNLITGQYVRLEATIRDRASEFVSRLNENDIRIVTSSGKSYGDGKQWKFTYCKTEGKMRLENECPPP